MLETHYLERHTTIQSTPDLAIRSYKVKLSRSAEQETQTAFDMSDETFSRPV